MIRCDALIVGGGPAGLAAAIALRRKNLDVLVLAREPETFPRMLAMHLAEERMERFLLRNGAQLAWRLLTAHAAS